VCDRSTRERPTKTAVIRVREFDDIIYSLIIDRIDEGDVEIQMSIAGGLGWGLWVSTSKVILGEQ
jgi:hypothetical protein